MRFRAILTLATLFMACLTAAVFSQPLPAKESPAGSRPPENQSVSGNIASVGDAEFTVSITKDKEGPKTVQFLVDDKTKVEGKLAIGAAALVESSDWQEADDARAGEGHSSHKQRENKN